MRKLNKKRNRKFIFHSSYNYRRLADYLIRTTQQAHHGQITSKQRYINVDSVGTTLFRHRLTMMCPPGNTLVIRDYNFFINSFLRVCNAWYVIRILLFIILNIILAQFPTEIYL